jgi:hypothetical protein
MYDSDQQATETEPDRGTHWIDLMCASAWVRTI